MKLLLVEDMLLMGAGLEAALNNASFDVHWVTNGQMAFDLLLRNTFRAIVLDINLPGLDGISLLKQLRSLGCTLPVLLLTACVTTRDKVRCFDSGGGHHFLVKTAELEDLIECLHALICRAS